MRDKWTEEKTGFRVVGSRCRYLSILYLMMIIDDGIMVSFKFQITFGANVWLVGCKFNLNLIIMMILIGNSFVVDHVRA